MMIIAATWTTLQTGLSVLGVVIAVALVQVRNRRKA